MTHDEAIEAYNSLRRILRDLENNLQEGESIGVESNFSSEFYISTLQRNGTLVALIGDTNDGELEELVFAPNAIAVRFFTAKRTRKKSIGFIQADD